MKQVYALIFGITSLGLNAQTFLLNPGNSMSTDAPVGEFVVGTISMLNTSDEAIVLRWSMDEKVTPQVWDYSYCDYNTCYTGDQSTGTMLAVQPGNEGFIKVNAYTTAASSSYFKFSVWDENHPDDVEVIEFWFNGVASVKNENPVQKLAVYPNPANANTSVTIDHIPLNSKVKVVNSLGQVVFVQENTSGKIALDQNLPRGVYIVSVQTGSATESRKLIIK